MSPRLISWFHVSSCVAELPRRLRFKETVAARLKGRSLLTTSLLRSVEEFVHSIELIRENLKRSEDIVLARIEDMRDHCLVFPTPNGGCHTLWVLGHLAYIESLVIRTFMLGEANPLADWEEILDAEEVSGNAQHYPSFDRVLDECRSVRASTVLLLNSFTEADLDRASANLPKVQDNSGVDLLFGTYRRCFQYASDHWLMHRGQLADARCAAGVQRMWY